MHGSTRNSPPPCFPFLLHHHHPHSSASTDSFLLQFSKTLADLGKKAWIADVPVYHHDCWEMPKYPIEITPEMTETYFGLDGTDWHRVGAYNKVRAGRRTDGRSGLID